MWPMEEMTEQVLVINEAVAIPLSELEFRYSTSGGPGGQHANRSATRVTLLFDVVHSPSLTEVMRARLRQTLGSRLDGAGVLAIAVQDSRSQHQNRQLALVRLQRLLANGLRTPKQRHKTKPGRGAVERRLAAKKRRSQAKAARRQDREYP